jgi:hypothetical protein
MSLIGNHKRTKNVRLLGFIMCCILSLFIIARYMYLSIWLFDELLPSHKCIIRSSVFRYKFFHLFAIITVFQNFAFDMTELLICACAVYCVASLPSPRPEKGKPV